MWDLRTRNLIHKFSFLEGEYREVPIFPVSKYHITTLSSNPDGVEDKEIQTVLRVCRSIGSTIKFRAMCMLCSCTKAGFVMLTIGHLWYYDPDIELYSEDSRPR